uniref:Uncharacterized protein n=1 Tax=Globodera rostochiensis TaxID=31243 RepID=A0A914H4M2_GLORO
MDSAAPLRSAAQQMVNQIDHKKSEDLLWWIQMMLGNGTPKRQMFDDMFVDKIQTEQLFKQLNQIQVVNSMTSQHQLLIFWIVTMKDPLKIQMKNVASQNGCPDIIEVIKT